MCSDRALHSVDEENSSDEDDVLGQALASTGSTTADVMASEIPTDNDNVVDLESLEVRCCVTYCQRWSVTKYFYFFRVP